MLRKLLATTAVALLLTSSAHAQTTTAPASETVAPTAPVTTPEPVVMVKKAEGHLASSLIGETVYNSMGDDAEAIGDVNDLVVNPEGQIQAVIVGVGGFLGIGEKDVALEYDLLAINDVDGDEVLVIETTAEALEAQEEFDYAAYRAVPADADVMETKPATAEDLAKAPVKKEAASADQVDTGTPVEPKAEN